MQLDDLIFNGLVQYLDLNCQYKPHVVGRADNSEYPKVVVTFEHNAPKWQATEAIEVIGNNTCNIEIYAKDIAKADSIAVAEDIRNHIFTFMTYKLGYRLSFAKPTPNIDESIYRISIKYTYNNLRGL